MRSLKTIVAKLPKKPGVYLFKNLTKSIIYVGKAKSLKDRVSSYFTQTHLGPKTTRLISQVAKIDYILVDSEIEALLLEADLIKKFQPKYNTAAKDDKSHLYIKITVGSQVPLVTVTRREQSTRNVKLFGPFPQGSTVRKVLKILRPIFKFCIHKNPKRPCLYVHLGLCSYPYGEKANLSSYQSEINNLVLFLSGRKKQLIAQLKKQMREASENLEFEKAANLRNQIEKLEYITASYRLPDEFLKTPNLEQDIAQNRLANLAEILAIAKPARIECYDISNISGKAATGSMMVFAKGQPDKSAYRRFRIKTTSTPNDVAMMAEVLKRRFKNDWEKPDLVVLDGGAGQLKAAASVFKKLKLIIPYIALAKKEEEIYFPGKLKLKLPKESPALQLLCQIRDEAHRFAISYHKLLRKKAAYN